MDGAEKLAAIGARLKAEASPITRTSLRRKVGAAIRAEARPLANKAAARAREVLPHGGGLNDVVADRHTTISTLLSSRSAGVRLRRKDAASYQTNRGYVRHKTYGHTPWRQQMLPGATGWWSQTLVESAHEVTPAIQAVIDKLAAEIGAI